MLWLVILGVIGLLLFVMFHKPAIKSSAHLASWTPPIEPAKRPDALGAGEPAAPQPPAHVDTFDFNDVFGAKRTEASRDSQPRL